MSLLTKPCPEGGVVSFDQLSEVAWEVHCTSCGLVASEAERQPAYDAFKQHYKSWRPPNDDEVRFLARHLGMSDSDAATWVQKRPRLAVALGIAITDPKVAARCRKYKITWAEYAARLLAQDGMCGICRTASWTRPLHIDHDHIRGHVRGLLCSKCNTGLGQLGIDGVSALDRVDQIAGYLKQSEPGLTTRLAAVADTAA